ncbi:hypothetical protein LMG28688_06957 [Paraburkholderia caffeinitolerans]|uniref:Uncharacterized protein n=1 Tax=Paraburkholderia caffeinitolerans TaxID=1723730 RepID=A0A6J5H029_9BURK|nr:MULTISPECIES: hypothetical protein [Paraburkholderia]CAB3809296.1 hypothetical protein LMG28688_06957 [Paraburkholderia caffeinitolerans]
MSTQHDHHLFYLRDGMLYVKGVATGFVDGSFRYLGNGYFRLHGYIYYRGKREAAYSGGAVVKTWTLTRKDPPPPSDPDGPPPIIGCPDFPHLIFVLETSDGLHLEHEETYGFGKFPRGETCKSATGHTCAEFHRMQGDKK